MHWIMRLVTFVLALAFGVGFWLVLAYGQTTGSPNANHNGNINPGVSAGHAGEAPNWGNMNRGVDAGAGYASNTSRWDAGREEEAVESVPPTLDWGAPGAFYGNVIAPRITLRSEPSASSNVVATFDAEENDTAEILEARRDFLRVRFAASPSSEDGTRRQDYEGWVEWGAVVPYTSAVVVDAGSGEVVGRLALDYAVSSAAFSADGKRAVFYSPSGGGGHGDAQTVAYEVDTEDYRILRTLGTTADGGFAAFVYDGDDLHALAQTGHTTENSYYTRLHPFRVKGDRIDRVGASLRPATSTALVISRDGLVGFDVHPVNAATGSARVDVIDLRTLAVRNSFDLTGGEGESWPHEYTVSPDGSQLYYREGAGGGSSVIVIDTYTGVRLREIKPRAAKGDDENGTFWQDSVVGDSLLLKYWTETDEETSMGESHSVWLRPDGRRVPAAKGIDHVVEAGGARYAVNDAGTRLFKLDADGRVTERLKIARPESKHRPNGGEEYTVMGLHASPDGRHVIIFFGIPDSC